ncbi:molybdopterin-dependent oxidoreductase [Bacillus timonensis]|nr:molybdopterin-dependent oxidoreductase [Bacillus timonensis]
MWNKLKNVHSSNGWLVLLLFVTGLILFLPSLRGVFADFRTSFKNLHILFGVLFTLLFVSYNPLMKSHWKIIRKFKSKQANLIFIFSISLLWIVSGFILTFERAMSAQWTQVALVIHDLCTWVAVPIIVYHIVIRMKWLRNDRKHQLTEESQGGSSVRIPLSRRSFFKYTFATVLVLVIGPSFYKWLKQLTDDGGMAYNEVLENTKNHSMKPLPVPAIESNPPVGGGLKGNFRVYTVTDIPYYTEENWYFQIDGLVENPILFTWQDFINLKRTVQVSDFHCVTGWSVYSVTYEGILLKDLLKMVNVQPHAKYVKFYSGDGVYTDALSLSQATMNDVMVALFMDGNVIPSQYGGPVRLIVPKMYAYKAVKWLVRIEVVDQPHLGYWQVRGYDTDAWVKN